MICVDASLVVKWVTPEDDSQEALRLYGQWLESQEILIAPILLDYEVASVVLKKVKKGLLPSHQILPAFAFYQRLRIQLFHETELVEKGMALTQAFEGTTLYDCLYLALAEAKATDFYTCDKSFYNKVKGPYPRVKCVGL